MELGEASRWNALRCQGVGVKMTMMVVAENAYSAEEKEEEEEEEEEAGDARQRILLEYSQRKSAGALLGSSSDLLTGGAYPRVFDTAKRELTEVPQLIERMA
mmetsp:Transcript_50787/g.158699  ORF Transcript_50787/g.158699 Transcript_50787/m.158699 type:complete len:102 (-) Transcript_50787:1002-1307(-)